MDIRIRIPPFMWGTVSRSFALQEKYYGKPLIQADRTFVEQECGKWTITVLMRVRQESMRI